MADYQYSVVENSEQRLQVKTDTIRPGRSALFGLLDQVILEWSRLYFGAESHPISVSLNFIAEQIENMPITVKMSLKHQTGSMVFFQGDVGANGEIIATCSGMIKKSRAG